MYKIILFFSVLGIIGCTAFFFQPLEKHYYSPSDLGLDYQDVYFSSLDDTHLHGWWLPARGEAKGSVLFLHGNAENISTHIRSIMFLPDQDLRLPDHERPVRVPCEPAQANAGAAAGIH